jgi:hypothetical protein
MANISENEKREKPRDRLVDPNTFVLTRAQLAAAVREELIDFFHDGVFPTLGEYAFGHIVGGIIQRVEVAAREDN